ncbi:3-hydroxyacyl-CoA dehydrogenase [Streptomyces sp. SID8361]|uniref:3-hydroxyacyl-CoA dehydrogenase NAD-binding domain-containing protein n=1 Tax=Streptomyces sp. MnatMP-M27 TaxID=1839768 RepID=UPI00081E0DDB|nr:3-hydroxyacyl-CoA dehydrogenase NAD-binding domain-containing protein [Streptomyces sp. MnatMP-M27]MYU11159.1 3-hydroxyacyl-CoA dehydrogenase [Streptomyces sp. SID8361]SCF78810.1 3-hydroxyacyl-CoA dehydrogenase [Streptomyces sp. MnatMP-M27]
MSATDATAQINRVAVVGAGAIGASWTALLLSHGREAVVADPDPDVEDRLRASLAAFLGADAAPYEDRLTFTRSPAEAAARADLVLEAGPERLELKRWIVAEIDAAAAPEVLIASSSSGLMPSSFQESAAHHPERVLVVHPFNPPHLMPLVEVVGGTQTSEEAVERAVEIFRGFGKRPIRLRRELPGHVANRLQAALWREAYHLVQQGVVSVADLDTAIASGPGLRWALLGPLATQHLSGGGQGLRHVLAHLGPAQVAWWADLGSPELTPVLIDELARGVDAELADRDEADLLARRDEALRELLASKDRLGLA